MLSDEERKAIEIEDSISILENTDLDINNIYSIDLRTYNVAVKTVVEVIKKQSKEIEHQKEKRENQKKELAILNAKQVEFNKLVNTVNSYKGQFKRQQKEIEELKEDSCCMTNCVRRDKEKLFLEEKIKAKIEEIDKILERNLLVDSLRDYFEAQKEVLQSLLDKE